MTRRALAILSFALGAVIATFVNVSAAAEPDLTSCHQERPFHDLNGDGHVDAVVGDPHATVNGKVEAGTVTVLFGGADGRIGEGVRRVLTQLDLGDTPEAGDHFGWSVGIYSAGFEDGCSGLMIGAPGEDVDGHEDAGLAHIYLMGGGPEDEPPHDVAHTLDQSEAGGTVEAGDESGFSVAASYVYSDVESWPSFTFGAPGENDDAGVVNLLNGETGSQLRQGSGGLPGRMQAGDRFGEVIGSYFYLPEYSDITALYIGAPGDVVGGKRGAGSVTVAGAVGSPRLITQNTSGVPGVAETGDHFGATMASGNRQFRQLAIGAPGEDIGSVKDAGSVTVLKRTEKTVYPATLLTQATPGVSGTVETGDRFGAAVAYRDDRTLAIGIPGEDLGTVIDAGSVQIARVGKSKLSFPSPSITENSTGTPGVVQADSRFGTTVTGVRGSDGEAIFALSSPFQDGGSVYVMSSDPTIDPRSWQPGTGTVPGTRFRFGQSVA